MSCFGRIEDFIIYRCLDTYGHFSVAVFIVFVVADVVAFVDVLMMLMLLLP